MTLKYEAEILFDLMKRDGDDTPSDVLPYESELKEKYLEQVEGAYPKLQDYRSEWLNYNLNANLPADFPDETVSNVTNATFENVVPYVYGSAILTGQTLVNQSTSSELTFKSAWQGQNIEGNTLQSGKKYFVSFNLESDNSELSLQARNGNTFVYHIQKGFTKGKNILSFILEQDVNGLKFQVGNDFNVNISNIVILEHQEGMENWDIPFFTGMQSVQMPVLTTSNEDGTKTIILSCLEPVELGSVGEVKDELNLLTQQLTQRTETRPYQEGDELNSEFVTDMTNTRYKLAQEVVKTVDLTVTDQDGNTESIIRPIEGTMHVSTSSQTLPPLLDMSVPVEATSQNLMSFANIVEEEK